jgi:cytochrome c-type biogenesis protein CcmH
MTGFVIGCAAMLLVALAWMAVPLLRANAGEAGDSPGERRLASGIVSVAIVVIAIGMYAHLSNWNWHDAEEASAQTATVDSMLKQLEAKLAGNPEDLQGWLLLGRSNVALQRFGAAADAYQRAYDLTKGENLEAVIGLGEALALLDQNSLMGRAGELFETALAKAPTNPKALWYGSVAALQKGDLRTARDRLQGLLAQNPPEQLQAMLQRQVQDLNEQLGESAEGAQAGASAAQNRVIRVAVSIAPAIQQQLTGSTPLFILARDPAAPGPPLAVERHDSSELPLTVELTSADAMVPSRTIANAARVQVVARLSLSGAPQERTGDFFGQADYDFSKDTGTLQIIIDRAVP